MNSIMDSGDGVAPAWAEHFHIMLEAVYDEMDGVTNDVEGEHANDRNQIAEGGITFDDFTAKTFNKGVKRVSATAKAFMEQKAPQEQQPQGGGQEDYDCEDDVPAPAAKRRKCNEPKDKRGGCGQSG